MDTFIIIGAVLIVFGIIGSILPAMPGPFFSFLGIMMLFFSQENDASLTAVIVFGAAMAILMILDYVVPIAGAKYAGAGKRGIWGAIFGAIIGLIFFPPLGIFIGAIFGAVAGEMTGGKKILEAVRAGAGVAIGSFSVMALQVIYSLAAAAYFVIKLI
jgi:hypothetical protein